jgi:hypothetical protein
MPVRRASMKAEVKRRYSKKEKLREETKKSRPKKLLTPDRPAEQGV